MGVPYFPGCQIACEVMHHENYLEMVVTYLSTNSTSSFNRAHLERRDCPYTSGICEGGVWRGEGGVWRCVEGRGVGGTRTLPLARRP